MANGRWPPLTIADCYRAVIEELKRKIDSTADDQVLGMDLDEWVADAIDSRLCVRVAVPGN